MSYIILSFAGRLQSQIVKIEKRSYSGNEKQALLEQKELDVQMFSQ